MGQSAAPTPFMQSIAHSLSLPRLRAVPRRVVAQQVAQDVPLPGWALCRHEARAMATPPRV